MVLRNHGLLVVGRTIPATFNLLYRMERACEVQVMALSCNTKLVYPPQDVLEATFDRVKPRPELPNRNGDLAWPALLRKLDRTDPSYKNCSVSARRAGVPPGEFRSRAAGQAAARPF